MNTSIAIKLSKGVREEWIMKEEGSHYDNGKPETGHIYCILRNNWKSGKLLINNEEELALVQSSASYQTTWNSDDPGVKKLEKRCTEIVKELRSVS